MIYLIRLRYISCESHSFHWLYVVYSKLLIICWLMNIHQVSWCQYARWHWSHTYHWNQCHYILFRSRKIHGWSIATMDQAAPSLPLLQSYLLSCRTICLFFEPHSVYFKQLEACWSLYNNIFQDPGPRHLLDVDFFIFLSSQIASDSTMLDCSSLIYISIPLGKAPSYLFAWYP